MLEPEHNWNTNRKPLYIGYILSIIITFLIYILVAEHQITSNFWLALGISLACSQAIVQLVTFLHLGIENKPYWNLLLFGFMVLIITVVIGGSLFIMHNLNYNVGT